MKNFTLLLFLCLFAFPAAGSPLHSKQNHSVIIETDCDNSDLRAISIMLSHKAVRITAIVVSGDHAEPENGIKKIRKLLSIFSADTIPVLLSSEKKDIEILIDQVKKEKEKLSLIDLGKGNISFLIRDNEFFAAAVEDYIRACENNNGNPEKYFEERNFISSSGVHFNIIRNLYIGNHLMDKAFTESYEKEKTRIAEAFRFLARGEKEIDIMASELAALYLINPELFSMSLFKGIRKTNIVTGYEQQMIKDLLADMIAGRYKSGNFVALYGFPLNPELYTYDIRMIMDTAIARYGVDEWKACVMTDEFHGHLGVYSIVGAKMGIRAREYFGIGTDLLSIISYGGSVTPFSCMNDGLQVSTGATLGQGTIKLAAESVTKPQAIFTYKGKSIILRLKPEYINQLRAVIEKGVKDYGLDDEGYWNLVRQTSIKFWLEWDRKEIFELEEVDSN